MLAGNQYWCGIYYKRSLREKNVRRTDKLRPSLCYAGRIGMPYGRKRAASD